MENDELETSFVNIDNALLDIQQRLERIETNTDSRLMSMEQKIAASETFLGRILDGLSEFKESPLVKMLGAGKNKKPQPSTLDNVVSTLKDKVEGNI